MSQLSTNSLASVPRSTLRIVLFGMPDAGKSSLLEALAQVAQSQEQVLRGKLVDESQGLGELQRRLYEGAPKQTLEEVAPFPISWEPFPATPNDAKPESVEAVLIDCDGQVANEFLSRQRELNGDRSGPALGHAVLAADTLVLVVDASASQEVIKRDFSQFGRFMRVLEQSRSERTEVAGLPVYLVLTKCDLLARKNDTTVTWMERIEEHKRAVDRKFQEYLAQHMPGEAQPFGKIDLHLRATAVKRPALGENQAKPRDPYGVAELFRQALGSATAYRDLQQHASRKLRLTVAGLLGLVAIMILLGGLFWAGRQSADVAELENDIRRFRSTQGDTAVERLKDPLDEKIKQLKEFEQHEVFEETSPEMQSYVTGTLAELEAFQRYRKELLEKAREPKFIRNDSELNRLLDTLKEMPLPPEYAEDWQETKVGKLREQWRKDAEILRTEVNKAQDKFENLLERRAKLRTEALTEEGRRQKIEGMLNESEKLPYREDNKKQKIPGTHSLTYENVLQFDRVAGVYQRWKTVSEKLRKGE